MTLHGHVQNGMIVVDGPVPLPEGATVEIRVVEPHSSNTIGDRPVLKHAGTVKGLGPEASRRIDEELYGSANE